MGILEAIIIGIIQGLSEFLPVSSSGHIELAKEVLSVPKEGMLFTIVVHTATALSTIVIFRKDIVEIIKGLLQFKWNDEFKFSLNIVISMIPAAFVGLFFEDEIDEAFSGNILLVGLMLVVTGLLLFLADRSKTSAKPVGIKESIIIGISQAIAILPGISRSGATIGTSVLLGVDRSKAARFSFLMVIPLIAGAMLVKTKKLVEISELESQNKIERVSTLMEEFEKDNTLSIIEKPALMAILQARESQWEESKGKKESFSREEQDIYQEQYKAEVNTSVLSKELKKSLIKDKFLGFRSVFSISLISLICGFAAAFITGLFACQWMISLVKKAQLKYFSYYCFVVGFIAIIYAAIIK
jgi:undecaprenyl-diphosphatase